MTCLYRKQKGRRHRHTEEGHVKMEAEIRVIWPKAKECLEPPEVARGNARILPLVPWQGAWPCRHLDFGLWPPDCEKINFGGFFGHTASGILVP